MEKASREIGQWATQPHSTESSHKATLPTEEDTALSGGIVHQTTVSEGQGTSSSERESIVPSLTDTLGMGTGDVMSRKIP